jgi:hypothetical protein
MVRKAHEFPAHGLFAFEENRSDELTKAAWFLLRGDQTT